MTTETMSLLDAAKSVTEKQVKAQAAEGMKRWERQGREIAVVPLSPDADEATVEAAAREMAEHAPNIVVHDCISYKRHARDLARVIHGRETLLAVSFAALSAAKLAGT